MNSNLTGLATDTGKRAAAPGCDWLGKGLAVLRVRAQGRWHRGGDWLSWLGHRALRSTALTCSSMSSGRLQILQDLNKTWLLINRLNAEKPEREAAARTRSQWKLLCTRRHGQTRLRVWNDCDGSSKFSLFNALLFPAPCGYSSAGDGAAEWWHHIPQSLTSHGSSWGRIGGNWPLLSSPWS